MDNGKLLAELASQKKGGPDVVILRGPSDQYPTYDDLIQQGRAVSSSGQLHLLQNHGRKVLAHNVCNLQFTSGTTGSPKAAMLTHHNIVNNARFIGDRMRLGPDDVLCCPPPLFHCFGLVLGLMAVVTHGAKIVYPEEVFDPAAVLRAISDERCTAVHGVPAMFDTLFSLPPPPGFNCDNLRTGIIAGAPVPRYLMQLLVDRFGMTEFTSSYGLTEASPTCFNAFTDDAIDRRLTTVGTIMPHARAKIVDHEGNVVPVGTRGELCMAGYQLQAGYWNNSEKTAEVMVRDEAGVLWLHTGDEAVFDEEGYCSITGRFKDIIIRGGFFLTGGVPPTWTSTYTCEPCMAYNLSRRREHISARDRGAPDNAPRHNPSDRHRSQGCALRRGGGRVSTDREGGDKTNRRGDEGMGQAEAGET